MALQILFGLIDFYEILIIVYIIMSWLRPTSGFIADVYRTLGTIVEPWLGIFRRLIPPIGMIDISPIIALLVLGLIPRFIGMLLG